ncbi:hypothetical protein CRM22_004113 [Opisthorchis felineus]|uniref:Uncharacterized protein n=1 Tax=Opisthorchis felineus TaxID=147828 RepID=A0A4S2LXU8_OPIFE|nr:hypothetical protein CRM22_004113 [Opisthorchis felineus]
MSPAPDDERGRSGGTKRMRVCETYNPMRLVIRFVFILTGVYIGISVAVPGATLIYVERFTSSREDEVALIFSARAVGSLSGWLLGTLVLDMRGRSKPTRLLGVGIAGIFLVDFVLPLAAHIWWAMLAFVSQGCFMALTTTGCLAYARVAFLHSKPRWSQHMVFACLVGCVVTPFMALPFFPAQVALPQLYSLSSFLPENLSPVNDIAAASSKVVASNVDITQRKRLRRAALPTNFSSAQSTAQPNPSLLPTQEIPLERLETPQTPLVSPLTPETNISTGKKVEVTSKISDARLSLPTKPSVNDAKHLNQDSSSADGSQTASKMKQLGEDRRIDTVGGAAGLPPPSSGDTQIGLKPPLDVKSSDTTTSTTKPALPDVTSPRLSPDGTSEVVPRNENANITTFISQQPSFALDVNLTTGLPPTTSPLKKILITPLNASNSESVSIPVLTTPNGIANISSQAPIAAITTQSPGTSTVATATYAHIAEHRSHTQPTHHLSFLRPLVPIQSLHIFLGLMGLLLWLSILPLIGWCPSCTCFKSPSSASSSGDELRLRRLRSSSSTVGNGSSKLNGSQHDVERHPLLPCEDEQLPDYKDATCGYRSDVDIDETHYLSACEAFSDSELVGDKTKPTASNFMKRWLPTAPVPLTSMDGNSAHFDGAPPTPLVSPAWPRIYWPSDAWLLLAQFLNIGLETTYGAFIHWFTIRYLLWNPAVASLALSLFWLGGLVGRLPCLFLVETKLSSHSSRGTRSNSLQSSHSWSSLLSSSTHWLLSMIRLCGSVLCVISAVAITRLSVSTARYKLDSIPTTAQRPVSHNYFTWLGGSLFLGLGVGVSSSGVDSLLVVHHTDGTHRLQLAGHLGQMLVPPIVAYLHHLAVFHRYTYVLGTSVLVLSILLSFVLVADVLRAVMCCSPEVTSASRVETESPSKPHRISSPVTLHTVEHP